MIENYKRVYYKLSYYPPYKSSSNNIKVELDLSNYATKDDVKNITNVDVSSYATKTNLSALKTEVDKIVTDKLKTVPDDLAKLSNVVKNEVVKKTDFSTDTNSLDDKIDKVEKKIPDISSLETKRNVTTLVNNLNNKIDNLKINDYAKKTSLTNYMLTSTFIAKSTELESKIKDADIIAKSAVTKANSIKSDLNDYAKKDDVANDITTIKNDYVTNASLTSRLNDLKSQHIATEVKAIDDKTKKNMIDILDFESRLKQKEDIADEVQKEISFNKGFFYYLQQNYLVYECKVNSFAFNGKKITNWKSTGIFNYSDYYTMNGIEDTKTNLPILKNNKETYVLLQGKYFQQNDNIIIPSNNKKVINIYIIYKIDPISSTRNTDYTIQNALFGAMKITKNADYSKNNYTGYGLCFDEGGEFGHTVKQGNFNRTTNARNVIIFGVDTSSSAHATNRTNNIYVMGKEFIQGINGTTIYAEKLFHNDFTELGVKFVLSLHYNGDNSYLFANGRQELKFKRKDDQMINEKLCLGNLSCEWTKSESEKTGLYGNIYDFVVDYRAINGVKPIYDMHRYLMTKHNISL